jgi:hypothetical protein
MSRLGPVALVCLLLLGACSGGPSTDGDGAGATGLASSDDPFGLPSQDFSAPTGRPSGAKVRILNAYAPLTGEPGPIDVHAAPFVLEGAQPLLSIPYGTVSDYFDPTVADDAGDMFLSMYRAGETGNGNALITQTETLKGGEIMTMVVTTGGNEMSGGGRFGAIQVFFHAASGGTFGQATPEPGKGLLIVSTVGLEQILPDPGAAGLYLKVSGDSGCTKAIGNDEFTLSAAGPGSATPYSLDPGSYTAAIYSIPNSSGDFPQCTGTPFVGDIAVSISADQTSLLEVYGPTADDIRTMVLPFDK